jgi:hypothetical protein
MATRVRQGIDRLYDQEDMILNVAKHKIQSDTIAPRVPILLQALAKLQALPHQSREWDQEKVRHRICYMMAKERDQAKAKAAYEDAHWEDGTGQ